MAKSFNLQDNETFCIFVTKDKRQAIILIMSYIEYLQILTAKAIWNFLINIVIFKLSIFKMIKGTGLMTPRRFNIYMKPFQFLVKHIAQEQIRNAEIIARTQDIKDV